MANRKMRLAKESAIRIQQAGWRLRLQRHNQRKKLTSVLSLQHWTVLLEADFKKNQLPKRFQTAFILKTADRFRNFLKEPLGIYSELKYYRQPQIVAELVAHRVTRRLMSEPRYQTLIFRICRVGNIIRPIRNWRPARDKRMDMLLWDFFKHLCVRYPNQMPICFRRLIFQYGISNPCQYNVYSRRWAYRYRDLQVAFHIADGKGIHEIDLEDKLGINSRTQFYFLRAPKHLQSFYLILHWARLRSLNLSEVLADYFTDEYWNHTELAKESEMLRFFNRYPDLEPEQAVEIYDFVKGQKSAQATVEGFEIRPLFPNFSFKKRTLPSVMRSVQKWCTFVEAHIAACSQKPLPKSEVCGFEEIVSDTTSIRIEQLLTLGDLRLEGFHMQHCVATYYDSCVEDTCTIWSVRRYVKGEQPTYLATIELSSEKEVVQLNGRFNADPPALVRHWVRKWARQEKLSINVY
ncbi:MAG: PcfJ domain-containing protein [Bacteroidota bacterium]